MRKEIKERSLDGNSNAVAAAREFHSLVAETSRLLFLISKIPPFQDHGCGLAEWATLFLIFNDPAIDNKKLAVSLGIDRARAISIKTALAEAHLISLPSKGASPDKSIVVTQRGKLILEDVDSALRHFAGGAGIDLPELSTDISDKLRTLRRTLRNAKIQLG